MRYHIWVLLGVLMPMKQHVSTHREPQSAQLSREEVGESSEQDRLGNAAIREQMGSGDADDPRDRSDKQSALDTAFESALELIDKPDASVETLKPQLDELADLHGLKWLRLRDKDGPQKTLDGKVNPVREEGVVVLEPRDRDELRLWVRNLAVNRTVFGAQIQLQAYSAAYHAYGDHPWLNWLFRAGRAYIEYITELTGGNRAATFMAPGMPGAVPDLVRPAVDEMLAIQTPPPIGADKASDSSASEDAASSSGKPPAKSIAPPASKEDFQDSTEALKGLMSQRPTKRSWSEDQIGSIRTLLGQLDGLSTLYVADDDKADGAYAEAGLDRIPIHRSDTIHVPNNTEQGFEYNVPYSSGENRYIVTLLADAAKGVVPDIRAAPFPMRRRAGGGGTGAKGRAFRGTQGFFANPAYWGDKKPDDSVPKPATRAKSFGVSPIFELANQKEAERQGLVPQSASATEPWVFCVPEAFGSEAARPDPRQAANPGMKRRQVDDFDKLAADRNVMRATVYQTRTPAKRRGDAGREPQAEAGGTPASHWMGAEKRDSPAYAAASGQLGSHEYCHLIGDGDSGDCSSENLVVGTSGVNTEQLAMEETLRPYRPRLRKLGYSMRLTVTAIVDNTPFSASELDKDVTWPQWQMAEFIRYEISANAIDQALADTEPIPVHTQVMDGQRGVISEAEVDLLKQTVAGKLDRVLEDLAALEGVLTGKRSDQEVDEARYESEDNGRRMPMTPSYSGFGGSPPPMGDQRRPPRGGVLRPGLEDRGAGPQMHGAAQVGRYSQGDHVGGNSACAGTSVRAADRLLRGGYAGLDVEDTVQRGVADYLAVRAEHPGAPPFLASYEMRTSPANQDLELELIRGMTLSNGNLQPLRLVLADGWVGRAATLTAGAYTFTAASLADGTLCIFDSHANRIHGRAYKESFDSMAALMRGIKAVITQHGVNLHEDIAAEVYEQRA